MIIIDDPVHEMSDDERKAMLRWSDYLQLIGCQAETVVVDADVVTELLAI